MRVTFDPAARDDLERIVRWIAKDNPHAANALIDRIEAKVNR
jgi:plasmid stabilization system protein ParE